MTLFEFLSVAISIVLALSAGQILTNLREVFDPSRRYWVHALYVFQILLIHILNWWSLWAYRDISSWNLATFAVVLLGPGFLFICSSTLVPSYAQSVASWEEHFYKVRRWFFAARSLFIVVAGYRTWLLLDKPVLESPTPVSFPLLILSMLGLTFANRRVHRLLAVVSTGILLFGVTYFRLEAGTR